jgi:Na+-driven multidrug efflux pump
MLGKDNPQQAKRFAICCVVVAVSLVSTLAMIINIFPYQIAGMFTKDRFNSGHSSDSFSFRGA